jgi:outer membrane lipoprotein-sorting protein
MFPAFRLPLRRFLSLGLAVLAAPGLAEPPATLSADDQALVERARTYLLGLSSAVGRFTQTDPHGHVTTGALYLRRPGRARFEYDPPSGLVVASNGFRVAVLNRRLGTLDAYPLGLTPLGVLLSRDIRIDQNVEVGAVKPRAGGFSVVAVSSNKHKEGKISLNFNDLHKARADWEIPDPQGAAKAPIP